MKAFITLESLLEYFVFSTETLQHEDDLIAHSKVSKERPQVQRENNIPQFHASLLIFIIIFFLQVFPTGGGEVPCGGALLLPLKVIPGPSATLPLIHSCLIKVDNIVFSQTTHRPDHLSIYFDHPVIISIISLFFTCSFLLIILLFLLLHHPLLN